MGQSAFRRRKLFQDLNAGSKQKKESFVSFSGDGVGREKNVSELKKFIYQSAAVRYLLRDSFHFYEGGWVGGIYR